MDARDVAYVVGVAEYRLGPARRDHAWPWLRDDDGGFLTVDAFWPEAAVTLVVESGPLHRWRYAPAELLLRDVRIVVLHESDLPACERDRLARDDRALRDLLETRGLFAPPPVPPTHDPPSVGHGGASASTAPLDPGAQEDRAGHDIYDADHLLDAEDPPDDGPDDHARRVHEARTLTRADRPAGGDIWGDALSGAPDLIDDPIDDLDWSADQAGAPPGWRSGPRLLAVLGAAALARRSFEPALLGGLEPLQVEVLATLHLSVELGPAPRTDSPAGLARRLGHREIDVREAVGRLAALGLLWEVQWMDDRLLVTHAGRRALDAWLSRIAAGFGPWPDFEPGPDDAAELQWADRGV